MTQETLFQKKQTQEKKILKELIKKDGAWINGQFFLKIMMISQYHRAIHNLIKHRERYNYTGQIEPSTFKDEFGFKSYRLV